MKKTAIITGITGQDGPYLAKLLMENDYKVIGLTRSYTNIHRNKFQYLNIPDVHFVECDLTDFSSVVKVIQKYAPSEIYNLAAQSSVGLSFDQPIGTMQYNILSVLNVLEAIRMMPYPVKFYQASSSDMFGKVSKLPITTETPMHPLSPYAISKASAFWTVNHYRESYGVFASNGILFNHESILRSQNFFVKKVITEAIQIKQGQRKELRVGNLDLKRDFGYAPEYVKAMWLILQQQAPDNFIVCSGTSVSLREIVYYIFNKLEINTDLIIVDPDLYRPSDIEDIYGDNSRSKQILGWHYDYSFFHVLDLLLEEQLKLQQENIVLHS